MAALIWSHTALAGVESIDNQHGILLDQLNELRSVLVRGANPAEIRPLIRQVSQLFHLHIESEARLLAGNEFPGLAQYNAEGRGLFERLAVFDLRFEQRQANAVFELVEYLRKWFSNHTCTAGQPYTHWLRSTGTR